MGWKNFSMSVPALKTAPMILLKLFAWNDIINGMSKWLHLWPPIFLAYFWLSRLCEQSNSHTSKVDMFFSNYIVIVVRKFSPNIKMHQKTKRVFVQLPMHTCVIISVGCGILKLGGPKKQDLLIFVNNFFFEKIPSIFDIKIDFESTILALFDEP